jgi:hypothetical protein
MTENAAVELPKRAGWPHAPAKQQVEEALEKIKNKSALVAPRRGHEQFKENLSP